MFWEAFAARKRSKSDHKLSPAFSGGTHFDVFSQKTTNMENRQERLGFRLKYVHRWSTVPIFMGNDGVREGRFAIIGSPLYLFLEKNHLLRSESGKPPEATNQPIDRPTTRNHSTTRNHTPKFSGACGGLNQCSITRVYPLFVFLTIVSQQKQIASINITGSIQVGYTK